MYSQLFRQAQERSLAIFKELNMKKPNIVFILADDMGQWAMGCSGNDEVITPNIDSLADGGLPWKGSRS